MIHIITSVSHSFNNFKSGKFIYNKSICLPQCYLCKCVGHYIWHCPSSKYKKVNGNNVILKWNSGTIFVPKHNKRVLYDKNKFPFQNFNICAIVYKFCPEVNVDFKGVVVPALLDSGSV